MISLKWWLRDKPIGKKLVYSNVLGWILSFIPVVMIMSSYEYHALRNHVLREIRVQADIVGEGAAAAMAFHDEEAASEILSLLRGARDMIEAHLVLPDGTVFQSHYYKGFQPRSSQRYEPGLTYAENLTFSTITIQKPIQLRSKPVGLLILTASLESFYLRLVWYAVIIVITAGCGLYVASVVAGRISKMITEPLRSLTVATQKIITESDYEATITTTVNDEVGTLSRAFTEMISQIRKRDLTLQQLAYYDPITGIANRHYYEERITQTVENAHRYGTVCYLLMIDLDDFKIVNDNFGHLVGDLLLRHVSEALTNILRKSDSIFRIGGDEFAVIIESPSDHEAIDQVARKIIQAVSSPLVFEGHVIRVGASIGISCFPTFSNDVRMLMSSADTAMYAAKAAGKNRYMMAESV